MKQSNNLGAKFSLIGYILFLIPLTIVISSSILIYKFLSNNLSSDLLIVLILIIYIMIITLIFCFFDIHRRRVMVDKPVKQILDATQRISVGDFNVKLVPLHALSKYDEYDLIIENINKMAEELSKSEILKTEFISNVSHELKTPLSIIQNYAKALQGDLNETTKKKYLQTLVSTSQKLSNLIINILKLNKLENQTIMPSKEKVNVSEFLTENILQFESLLENKQIKLNCNIVEDVFLIAEPSYLEIIFNNLISNAIKFSLTDGLINISLGHQNDYVVFSIEDTGIGMNSEIGMRIFEKFYQADTSHSGEGNGLGLALVKKVIDIMGGEIKVESELGKGTKFIVKFKKDN